VKPGRTTLVTRSDRMRLWSVEVGGNKAPYTLGRSGTGEARTASSTVSRVKQC
jgi:hypothetical protein